MGHGQSMEDHLINLRLSAKQLAREAKKCESNAAANKLKCKSAMEKGNMDGARIYAETAIRDKNQSLNYLRLSSRIDAVSQRVNTAVKMKTLTKDMSGIVNNMQDVMKSMNIEKITAVMDKFEKQFEDLDLTTGVMEQSMQQSTAQTMPETQVESLMQQVADEHGLEFQSDIAGLPIGVRKEQKESKENIAKAKEIEIGGNNNNNNNKAGKKKGDDDNNNAGGGGGGDLAGNDDESLEARLRRLQGM
jgi:charged multivesicular body protein 1